MIQKNVPGHSEESSIARTTVITNMKTMTRMLQTIRVVTLPLKNMNNKNILVLASMVQNQKPWEKNKTEKPYPTWTKTLSQLNSKLGT